MEEGDYILILILTVVGRNLGSVNIRLNQGTLSMLLPLAPV